MHESTISRAIRDKYILTSMGTIKIKNLFVNSISNKEKSHGEEDVTVINIKKALEEVIKEEDKSEAIIRSSHKRNSKRKRNGYFKKNCGKIQRRVRHKVI